MKKPNSLLSLIGGGQVSFHMFRMARQVFLQFILLAVVVFNASLVIYLGYQLPLAKIKLFIIYGYAYLQYHIFGLSSATVTIDGYQYLAQDILYASAYIDSVNNTAQILIVGCWISLAITLGCFVVFMSFIYRQGRKQGQQKLISGSTLLSAKEINKQIKKNNEHSDFKLGAVHLPIHAPTMNIAMIGASGSGKSVSIEILIGQARSKGHLCIIYDSTGELTKNHYDPSTDTLLNPFDARSACWSIFSEIKHEYELDSLVAAIIPASGSDPFWHSAARNMLKKMILHILYDKKIESNKKMMKLLELIDMPVSELLSTINQKASKESSKTYESVKAMVETYMAAFKHLPQPSEEVLFSISHWLETHHQSSRCLFITALENQREAIRPLLTCWIHCATTSILNLEPNAHRRLWYFIDEMPSLNKLPQLLHVLTNARKYGGCGVIGLQSIPQLKSLYFDACQAILEGCGTHFIMRANGQETARWGSQLLGKQRIKEINKSQSYGSHQMRDGVTHAEQTREQTLISEHEITSLNVLSGYLKTLNYPICFIKLPRPALKEKGQLAFIAATPMDNRVISSPMVFPPKQPPIHRGRETEEAEQDNPVKKQENERGRPSKPLRSSIKSNNRNDDTHEKSDYLAL
jgi:type IV conjugative transfer system coupling protein TraD